MTHGPPEFVGALVPRRAAVHFVQRIADLKAEADARGYGTLSYFLDIAMREAMIQADREAHDRTAKSAAPTDLWLQER
jgi:hypothetical protein